MNERALESAVPWLKIAWEDLMVGKDVYRNTPHFARTVCHKSQECGEKALKGYLCAMEIEFEKTHNLTDLLKLCLRMDIRFEALNDCCSILTPYAVQTRYPDDLDTVYLEEAERALTCAENIFYFISDALGLPTDYTEYDDA